MVGSIDPRHENLPWKTPSIADLAERPGLIDFRFAAIEPKSIRP